MKKHIEDYQKIKDRIKAIFNEPDYVFNDKDNDDIEYREEKENAKNKQRICFLKYYPNLNFEKPFIKIVIELNTDDKFDNKESHSNNIVTGYFTGKETIQKEFKERQQKNLIYEKNKADRNKHTKRKNKTNFKNRKKKVIDIKKINVII